MVREPGVVVCLLEVGRQLRREVDTIWPGNATVCVLWREAGYHMVQGLDLDPSGLEPALDGWQRFTVVEVSCHES